MASSATYDKMIAAQIVALKKAQSAINTGFEDAFETLRDYQNKHAALKVAEAEEKEKELQAWKMKEETIVVLEKALMEREKTVKEWEIGLLKREKRVEEKKIAVALELMKIGEKSKEKTTKADVEEKDERRSAIFEPAVLDLKFLTLTPQVRGPEPTTKIPQTFAGTPYASVSYIENALPLTADPASTTPPKQPKLKPFDPQITGSLAYRRTLANAIPTLILPEPDQSDVISDTGAEYGGSEVSETSEVDELEKEWRARQLED